MSAKYYLESIFTDNGLWSHFQDASSLPGDEGGGCGEGLLRTCDSSADLPWNWPSPSLLARKGHIAKAPAAFVKALFQISGPFSEEYLANPYLPPCPVSLLVPAEGALLDNGCDDRSNGIDWIFDWTDAPYASEYRIWVQGQSAPFPIIDKTSPISNYRHNSSSSYIIGQNRLGFSWKVRVKGTNGNWGAWPEERHFDVEPLDTDCSSG